MSTTTSRQGVSVPGTAATQDAPALLHRAGIAALVAFFAMLATPIIVFGTDLLGDVDYADPVVKQDPVTSMGTPLFGIIFGLQSLVVAASVAVMVLSFRRIAPSGLLSELMTLAGVIPVACWLIYGGATAQGYSSFLQGDIADVQADPAVRAMVGFAGIPATQGVLGAAGVTLVIWSLLLHYSSRAQGLTGRLYLGLVAGIAVLAAAAFIVGIGAAATLLSIPLTLVIAVTMLRRARSRTSTAD